MNSIEKARKEVERRQGAVDKLMGEKESLTKTIDSLKAERSAAVRALAAGDESRRKSILTLEGKIKDRSDVLEGLALHLTEAQEALEKSKTAMKEAEAERERRFRDFLNEANGKEARKLSQDIEAHYQAALLAKKTLAKEMAEISILWATYEQRRDPGEKIVSDFLLGLPDRLQIEDQKGRFTPVDIPGFSGAIAVVPGVFFSELASDFKGVARAVRDHAKYREAKRRADLEREFSEKERE